MMEEVLPEIYRVEVPLNNNPLQYINSYIIKGRERNLVVDTGMDRDECARALLSAFAILGIDREKTDYFITHLHIDHLELVFKMASHSSKIFFNRPDARIFYDDSWDEELLFASLNGFPAEKLQDTFSAFANTVYTFEHDLEFTFLKEGDTLVVGNYRFHCLETPGHTPGSMCLFDPGNKILFTGDHILEGVTPNIALLRERDHNPLKCYLESLDKIAALPVDITCPGHRNVFGNPRQRIDELKAHHDAREGEILAFLGKNAANAYVIASSISWDLPLDWQEFPVFHQWFATGEALAHLKHLEGRSLVARHENGGKILFALPG